MIMSKSTHSFREELSQPAAAYAGFLAVVAVSLAIGLTLAGDSAGEPLAVFALCIFAAISERGLVRFTSSTSQSIAVLPTLFAAVLFGPLAAMAVGAASLLGEVFQPPHLKWVAYTSSRAIVRAATGLAASVCLSLTTNQVAGLAIATFAGAVVAEVLDVSFAAIAAQLRSTRKGTEFLRTEAPIIASAILVYTPLVTVLAIAYRD